MLYFIVIWLWSISIKMFNSLFNLCPYFSMIFTSSFFFLLMDILCYFFLIWFFFFCLLCRVPTEATFEILPRLYQIKFDRGVIDELQFPSMPHECRLSSGIMVLEYAKVVQESVYEHLHVVREGQLRIIFTPELKVCNQYVLPRHWKVAHGRRFYNVVFNLYIVISAYAFNLFLLFGVSDFILGVLCTTSWRVCPS